MPAPAARAGVTTPGPLATCNLTLTTGCPPAWYTSFRHQTASPSRHLGLHPHLVISTSTTSLLCIACAEPEFKHLTSH